MRTSVWFVIVLEGQLGDPFATGVHSDGALRLNATVPLEVLMTQWRHIQQRLNEDGPFIYSVRRTSFRPINLS